MPGDPVTLDLSQSQPIAGATAQPSSQPSGGVKLDLSQSQPVNGSAAPAEKPGLVSTVGSDLAGMGKGLLQFASDYIQHGQPYDPENPLIKVLSSQWDSSVQAKNRMMDAAKKGDALGAIQHAAGVIPVASQVDDAMTKYQAEPSHENLAHVITSALPAFVPSMMRGAGKLTDAVSETASKVIPSKAAAGDMLGKVNDAIGTHPVVADDAADIANDILDKQKTGAKLGGLKKQLQQFMDRATDPNEPLTFEEAREFDQNFRNLTTAQKMNMGAGVRPLLRELYTSLRSGIEDTADAAGQGDQFRAGMRAYRLTAQFEKVTEGLKGNAVKAGLSAAGGAAGGAGVKVAYDAYKDANK